MGIIDTLTAGFETAVRKPWLILIPLLLDLALLAAPKVSVLPVYDALAAYVQDVAAETAEGAAAANVASAAEQLDLLRPLAEEFNLLSLLSVNRLLLPSVASLRPIDAAHDEVIGVMAPSQGVGMAIVLVGLGLFVACCYWTLLAQQARRERNNLRELGHQVPVFWLRTVAVGGMVLAGLLGLFGVGTFLVLAAQVFALLGAGGLTQVLMVLVMSGMWLLVLWLIFYAFYVPQAITLAEAGPVAALQQSFLVVRSSFRQALGLFALVNVISAGLGYLWGLLMGTTAGTVGAIVANAFIGTGLMAALFIFVRDRIIALHQAQMMARG